MKEIKLTRGKVALVDDDDFEWLNQWKWYANNNYATRNIYGSKKTTITMHRLIMKTVGSKICVDHIDGNRLNNQRQNLRLATKSQNAANKFATKGTSKYLGVWWNKQGNGWQAEVKKNYIKFYVGIYKDEKEAALAYNAAAIEKHGEFARLNVIET